MSAIQKDSLKSDYKIFEATSDEVDVIGSKIESYNNSQVPFIQEQPFVRLNFCIKDDNDAMIAGIIAVMYCWGMLYVDVLAVDQNDYKKGLGSKLLSHVEDKAKKLGATLAHLNTFDFQAKDFYIKHGYDVFGVLDDCPPGHKRYY